MKNQTITKWEHFKKNYLGVSIFFFLFGLLALITIEPHLKWVAIFPLAIALIVIPIGNSISYNKKFNR